MKPGKDKPTTNSGSKSRGSVKHITKIIILHNAPTTPIFNKPANQNLPKAAIEKKHHHWQQHRNHMLACAVNRPGFKDWELGESTSPIQTSMPPPPP
ncbi:hypothetical protein JHK85_022850 [Glycine max]|nr:hypothetical protein JHK85_022850 [Glycine max]